MDEHVKKEKKKMSKGTKTLLIIACVIVGLAILLAATVFIMMKIGEGHLTDDGSNVQITGSEMLENGTIRYKGRLYRYNDKVTTILLMGIDGVEKGTFDGKYGNENQSDVNVLAIFDDYNKKLSLVQISRDAMCEIEVLDEAGNYLGPANTQLALAYSYGDGEDFSCELSSHAVSNILHGINVPAYASIYMDGIYDLVDIIGGVEVTPYKSFGKFTEGQSITLKGSLTEQYIRPRAHTIEGNNERMQRQNQVLLGMVHEGLRSAKNDPMNIPNIYMGVKDNVTTNLSPTMMVYLAKLAINLNFDGKIQTVPGESTLGEDNHAEFNIDEDALTQMIVDLYYIPVD